MMNYSGKNNKCNLCGSTRPKQVLWSNGSLSAVECEQCGLIYAWPIPTSEEMNKLYAKEYYQNYIDKINQRRFYTERNFNKIQPWLKDKKGKILDVGCGLGYFLDMAQHQGWEVFGLEPSVWAGQYAQDHFDVKVFKCSIEDARLPGQSFDLITFWDVLSHIIDPISVLRETHRILKDDGLILLRVPIRYSFAFRFAQLISKFTPNSNTLIHLPYQIYHFRPMTLKRLLSETGFQWVATYLIRDYYAPSRTTVLTWKDYLGRFLVLVSNRFRLDNTMLILSKKQIHQEG